MSRVSSVRPRRAAVLSVHTSPLDQPGTGDAGGLNVYVVETWIMDKDEGVQSPRPVLAIEQPRVGKPK